MHTTHNNCWDAKNRYGLPDEVDFDYMAIAHIIEQQNQELAPESPLPPKDDNKKEAADPPTSQVVAPPKEKEGETKEKKVPQQQPAPSEQPSTLTGQLSSRIPKALRDLMEANGVDEWDIQNVVAAKGYFPPDVPIEKYDETKPGFIAGVLVGAWPQVYMVIKEMKEKDAIVFNQ